MRLCQGQICYKINVKLHLSRPASAMKISSLPPSQDTSTTRDHLRNLSATSASNGRLIKWYKAHSDWKGLW